MTSSHESRCDMLSGQQQSWDGSICFKTEQEPMARPTALVSTVPPPLSSARGQATWRLLGCHTCVHLEHELWLIGEQHSLSWLERFSFYSFGDLWHAEHNLNMHTCARTCVRVYTHVCMHIHVNNMSMYMHMYLSISHQFSETVSALVNLSFKEWAWEPPRPTPEIVPYLQDFRIPGQWLDCSPLRLWEGAQILLP